MEKRSRSIIAIKFGSKIRSKINVTADNLRRCSNTVRDDNNLQLTTKEKSSIRVGSKEIKEGKGGQRRVGEGGSRNQGEAKSNPRSGTDDREFPNNGNFYGDTDRYRLSVVDV
jgi:hypothetical protein